MLNHQVQEIKMSNIACNLLTHEGKEIEALCLSSECKENATLCSKCLINSHLVCRKQVNYFEVIQNQLTELQQLSFDVEMLQEMINQQFKELLAQIEQLIKPISKCQNTPNLSNLNEIGSLLRKNQKKTILELIDGTKIQIKSLLDNRNQKQEKEKEKVQKVEQKQQELMIETENWYRKGLSLYCQIQFTETIAHYDQTIKMNENDQDSQQSQGRLNEFRLELSLQSPIQYTEAISCFDQAIKINPNHIDSWYFKGESLSKLGRFEEAIKCYEECNRIKPDSLGSELQQAKEALRKQRK